ncbi:MAG TPA: hypothetical protein VK745_18570 [Polyangiaceae bacterium]|nr:hypothetical protein [Polyangiaceae bacterium]
MTHDETPLDRRFVRKLAAGTVLLLIGGYGCSQAPNGLFSAQGGAPDSSDAAGFPASGGAGGLLSTNGGAANGGSSLVGASGSTSVAGAVNLPSAGAAGSAQNSAGSNDGGGANGASGGMPNGAGGTGGAPAPSACDGKLVTPPALVADFEQGVAGWYGYIGANPAPVMSEQPGAALTQHAAEFSGGAAKISGMYFPMACRDVSSFDGISFWGKSAATSAVRFLTVIPATDPTAGIGDCNAATMTCSDHPGKPLTFGPEWTLYHVAWSELMQLGFGSKASFAGVINALLWINDGPVDHFDFSIDEVNFYAGPLPTP